MKYFAYGSNMLEQRLKAANRIPDAAFYCNASAKGFRLRFHKRSTDGSGKCNIVKTANENDVVHGVVFDVPEGNLAALDRAEGTGHGYHRDHTLVVGLSHGAQITPLTYLADQNAIDDALRPYDWYFDLVIAGAQQHGLSNDYIAGLMAVPFMKDQNVNRSTRREAEGALMLYRDSLNS